MPTVSVRMSTADGGHRLLINVGGTRIEMPPVEHVAFYTGLCLLAAGGVIEWPLAITLSVGHILMEATRRPALQQFGEALEEA